MKFRHNLSHYRLLTGDMGQLLPCGLVEILPGDVVQHSARVMARVSPMTAPVMHPIYLRIHHFFVPHRLSWPENYPVTWEDFITGGPGNDVTDEVPVIMSTGTESDVLDYLGVPTVAGVNVSSLPVRAFNLVYNEWYRDQDLVTERDLEDLTVPLVSWEKDYFTAARPFAQRGPEVVLPIGDRADVKSATDTTYPQSTFRGPTGGDGYVPSGGAGDKTWDNQGTGLEGIWADLSTATGAKISEIRRAFALQRFAEVRARFGARYSEYLRHLGVRPLDERLQRPEFLGGGQSQINISEVLQTAPESAGGPEFGVGDMFGHGVALNRSNRYRRRFQEHGYLLSCLSVRPKHMHIHGVERTWLRRDREDFWQQELQWIGQQQVLDQEVYATGANKGAVFGYSDRYQEYRDQRSLVSAEFRSTLDYWHMARKFQSEPSLNASYVLCDATKRIHNEQTSHALWIAVQHDLRARRLVTRNASPRTF